MKILIGLIFICSKVLQKVYGENLTALPNCKKIYETGKCSGSPELTADTYCIHGSYSLYKSINSPSPGSCKKSRYCR